MAPGTPAAAQTILTVGPGGTYATLADAASQIVSGSDYEIRIRIGDSSGSVGVVGPAVSPGAPV